MRIVTRRTVSALAALAIAMVGVGMIPGTVHGQQTIGPVALSVGLGGSYQPRGEFSAVGPNLWVGAESVLDRRLRVRLDFSLHRFAYGSPPIAPCPPTTYCAPPLTSALSIGAITGTIVWRDTTGVRRWYWLAGLGTYSALGGRDANSRLGVSAGVGHELGALRQFFVEARVHAPYDGNHYGVFFPVTAGWTFGHFVP
jgi:hypothetical protein